MSHRQYLTISQLSELIGRSPAAIRNLCIRKRIPYRKPAGRLLFVSDEIEKWVQESEGIRLEDLRED